MFLSHMSGKERPVIYHVSRQNSAPLFLHPFSSPAKLISLLERNEPEGRYGREPEIESLTGFRNELYRMIESGVKAWISEIRFTPRLLVSAGTFLLVYIFFTVVVRDPLPFIDEILIACGFSIGVYLAMARRDLRSDEVLRKRVKLRSCVDRIQFTESRFVRSVETLLHKMESHRNLSSLDTVPGSDDSYFTEADNEDIRRFLACVERKFNPGELKKLNRRIEKLLSGESSAAEKNKVLKEKTPGNFDIPLFLVYTRMKRETEHVP